MKHYIKEIQNDHNNLSHEARAHIKKCDNCYTEYKIMSAIEYGISTIPIKPAPGILKTRVFERIMSPPYRLWHFGLTVLLLSISPLLLADMGNRISTLFGDKMLVALSAFFGLLIVILILPLSFQLIQNYGERIENLSRNCDDYLDHPVRRAYEMIQKKLSAL